MGLKEYAKEELDLLLPKGSDPMNDAMRESILEIVTTFSKQGHSGFSASYAIGILQKLLRFEPLTPLTGDDSEWNLIDYDEENIVYQNRRCSHVFKEPNGRAYDIQAIIFEDPNGVTYTSHRSHKYIKFPYTPKTKIVKVTYEDYPIYKLRINGNKLRKSI